jgi:hypothetical protein
MKVPILVNRWCAGSDENYRVCLSKGTAVWLEKSPELAAVFSESGLRPVPLFKRCKGKPERHSEQGRTVKKSRFF